MSTVDPAIVRRQELIDQFQQPQRPNWLLWALVLIVAALWGLFAYSVAHVAQYPVGDGYVVPLAYAADATPPMFWGIFVGAFGAFILGFLLSFVLAELYGLAATTWGSFALTQVAWALGLWRGAADSWLPPVPVGASLAAPSPPSAQWDWLTWLGWHSQHWLPLLLVAAALACAMFALRAYRKRVRYFLRLRRIVSEGARTAGVVTETHDTGVEILNQPRIRYVVKFSDHQGVERWVTKTSQFDAMQLPRAGDAAVVWFYPEHAGDESRIAVALGAVDDELLAAALAKT
ncbi:hypothetical protein [Lysobacter capsici]|uniref:hypothetical protein n=1 Tax=Lysobacter capsici TaxID=435897 RepID=UPI001BFFDFC3|nr:hypothetical protein [Lysobacter capsici]QWF17636.1 hypothetical protein KME82_02235 [Lysobacter capsici]